MRRNAKRHIATLCVFGLACSVLAGASAGTSAGADEKPAAMSWWGYWAGTKDYGKTGYGFVRHKQAKKYGTNVVLLPAPIDGSDAALKNVLDKAWDQQVGVILMLDRMLRKPSDPCGLWCDNGWVYNADDYAQWDARFKTLTDSIGDSKRALVAIVGFDEANVYGSIAFQPAPGQPHPLPKAMELAAKWFPKVKDRGHIWKIGEADPNATTLEGSTLPFAYYYPDLIGPFNDLTIPDCAHQDRLPAATPPDKSFLKQDETQLSKFVSQVNAIRGDSSTPVAYIPYSNRGYGPNGENPAPVASRGTACHLSSLYQWLRCKAQAQPTSWAGQIRGIVGWQWERLAPMRDDAGNVTYPGWTGTKTNRDLKQAGKWIGQQHVTPTAPCP